VIRNSMIAAAASVILVATGCRQDCCLNDPNNRPNPYRPPAPRTQILLPPAGGLPTTPAPPGGSSIVPSVGPDLRNYPPPELGLPLNKPPVEVLLPDPIPGGPSSRPSPSSDPGQGGLAPAPRLGTEPPAAAAPLAAGLPAFAKAKDGLASGGKPTLDGLHSLRQAGYRTVIYLHAAGVDVSAAKEVAEKRHLKFVAIETTPEKLAEAIGTFNGTVAETANRPAYVYADDGFRAGTVWYLHFRTADEMADDAARIRAKPLGLTDQGDEAKDFALATQRYLEKR
jgi:protein tyrosine phosphatase (PTP) superfamily phosphohydrolase (DUF442 family)